MANKRQHEEIVNWESANLPIRSLCLDDVITALLIIIWYVEAGVKHKIIKEFLTKNQPIRLSD